MDRSLHFSVDDEKLGAYGDEAAVFPRRQLTARPVPQDAMPDLCLHDLLYVQK